MARDLPRIWFGLFYLALTACGGTAPDSPNLDIILARAPAQTLAAYGLFADTGATEPAANVVSYDLVNPLFSDHAVKDRFVFIPTSQSADWSDEDAFAFPVGSVLIKSFSYAETGKIETRLLIHKDAGWKAYPYVWNQAHTEATYSPIGAKTKVETAYDAGVLQSINYSVPNQNQCKTCHQAGDRIVPIGPKARNLGADQVKDWERLGLLAGAPAAFESVPSVALEEGGLAARARAYLDINCAHCHKSDGAASNSGLWLEWGEENLTRLGVDKHPTAAGRGAGRLTRVIQPGSPDTSILTFRMKNQDAGIAMPELGRTLIDEEGLALVEAWILEMQKD